MADKLRSDIAEGKAEGERRIYIVFPNIKEHRNHAVYYVSRLTNVFYKPKFFHLVFFSIAMTRNISAFSGKSAAWLCAKSNKPRDAFANCAACYFGRWPLKHRFCIEGG